MDAIIDYRGKSPRKADRGVPLITAKVIKRGRVLTPNEFVAEGDYDAWMRRGTPRVGDVVITTEAPLGEVAQITDARVALAQRIILLRGQEGVIDNTFLRFLLQSPLVQRQLQARSTGTTVTGVRQSELRQVELLLPPIDEQRAIAHVLRVLDDKIDLNHSTNATLYEIRRALYRQMLEIGNSEARAVDQIATIKGGSTPSTTVPEYWNGDIAWATPKDLSRLSTPVLLDTERHITEAGVQQISSGVLPKRCVLLSSRAPIGYLAVNEIPVAINQGFIAMLPNKGISPWFLLSWAESASDEIKARANGTTFQEISKANFRPIVVAVPEPEAIRAFDQRAEAMHQLVVANEREMQNLVALRNLLLQPLTSGEFRIKDPHRLVEEAV